MSAIGIDGRVTGAQPYSSMSSGPGCCTPPSFARRHAHARVVSVDASELPDGCVALTPADVEDLGLYGCQARDQRVLADIARHVGDVVAAIAAPTRAEARAATG